jgi:hypothetical protein
LICPELRTPGRYAITTGFEKGAREFNVVLAVRHEGASTLLEMSTIGMILIVIFYASSIAIGAVIYRKRKRSRELAFMRAEMMRITTNKGAKIPSMS